MPRRKPKTDSPRKVIANPLETPLETPLEGFNFRIRRPLEARWKPAGIPLKTLWKTPGRLFENSPEDPLEDPLEDPWKFPGRLLRLPWKTPGRRLEAPPMPAR